MRATAQGSNYDDDVAGRADASAVWGPHLSFAWLTPLFRLLLSAQLPAIKKEFLLRLFRYISVCSYGICLFVSLICTCIMDLR